MKYFIYLILCMLVFTSCQSNSEPSTPEQNNALIDLKKELPGIWETITVRVQMNSVGNIEDSTAVFEVLEENWEKKLGIQPIRTYYYEEEQKFQSVYRAGNDSIINTTRGLWNTFGDTLMLIQPDVTYVYEVSLNPNGTGEFRSTLDWDGDGNFDDQYVGIQRRVSKSTAD